MAISFTVKYAQVSEKLSAATAALAFFTRIALLHFTRLVWRMIEMKIPGFVLSA
jgi:hypothetical protein